MSCFALFLSVCVQQARARMTARSVFSCSAQRTHARARSVVAVGRCVRCAWCRLCGLACLLVCVWVGPPRVVHRRRLARAACCGDIDRTRAWTTEHTLDDTQTGDTGVETDTPSLPTDVVPATWLVCSPTRAIAA